MDPLKCGVKAASVTNLTDARYFAAYGVNYLGFNLEQGTENAISPTMVAAFRDWIEGPILVGEFGAMSTQELVSLAEQLDLQAIQVGVFAPLEELKAATKLPIIQELVLSEDLAIDELVSIMQNNAENVEAFVLNTSVNNFSWEQIKSDALLLKFLKDSCTNYPIYIDLVALADDVEELLENLKPRGLQVRGGEEEAVGIKSFEELDDWFDVLLV